MEGMENAPNSRPRRSKASLADRGAMTGPKPSGSPSRRWVAGACFLMALPFGSVAVIVAAATYLDHSDHYGQIHALLVLFLGLLPTAVWIVLGRYFWCEPQRWEERFSQSWLKARLTKADNIGSGTRGDHRTASAGERVAEDQIAAEPQSKNAALVKTDHVPALEINVAQTRN